jgi:hypothetical protein
MREKFSVISMTPLPLTASPGSVSSPNQPLRHVQIWVIIAQVRRLNKSESMKPEEKIT